MPVRNNELAAVFEELADLLEIEDANPFRVRAYRNAVLTIRGLTRQLSDMVAAREDLTKLPGIGKGTAQKIEELVATGHLGYLEEIEKETAPGLAELLRVPGLGPARVRKLHRELGVGSREELADAAESGRIRGLPGFGAKTEARILAALRAMRSKKERILWIDAEPAALEITAYLKSVRGVKRVTVAGSFRRKMETVGDLDVLVTAMQGTPVGRHFVEHEDVERVVARGETRSTMILRSGFQVDLRVVPEVSYGAALHYFTGSKAHNIAVRRLGIERGYKVNEYGMFRADGSRVAGRNESGLYRAVDLLYVEPELRENRGEIEAAREKRLPRLVELRHIRGDLHAHTRASDGHDSIRAMAEAAKARGYQYLAVTDHTRNVTIANGLDASRMGRHLDAIDSVNAELDGIRVLKGAEVDILKDGSLDLPASVLDRLDLTVCAIHFPYGLSAERQTERILRAMDDPHFHVLAHPSGRLIGEREPYLFDFDRVVAGAAERGCFLELNAHPERLDVTDVQARAAKDAGVKIAISTDAHAADQLDFMRLGVGQARRGWLEPQDVLNTRTWKSLAPLLAR